MSYERIEVIPIGEVLGADICGIDLSKPLETTILEEICRAFLEFQVLCFRDQKISPGEQLAFAEQFGEIDIYPFMEPLKGYSGIIPVIKQPEAKLNFGGNWHTDTPYLEKPPKATILYAVEIPKSGGDTMFADMYKAYEELTDEIKERLDGVKGIYTAAQVPYQNLMSDLLYKPNPQVSEKRHRHPLIRTHPETGKKALFVSRCHVESIENWSEAESTPLLDSLAAHAVQPRFTMRFQWQVNTLLMWDNRCVQHYALNDYPGERREMRRIILKGDRPY